MNRYCANECDYHQQVINGMSRFPDQLKRRQGLEAFVWGHEVEMHDAGRGGGDGSADLFTGDEAGMVWLIEAKFGYNPELSRFVWEKQLYRYKQAIGAMSWQRLLHYTEAFLKGREATKPHVLVPRQALSFTDVLQAWQRQLGRVLVEPGLLNSLMAAALRSGTYGIMVLADSYVEEVVDYGKRFQHESPLAYVQGMPTETGVEFHVRWLKPAAGSLVSAEIAGIADPRFDAWKGEVNARCDPDSLPASLGEASRDLWLSVLRPGLLQLGWNGRASEINKKAFKVAFEVKGRSFPCSLWDGPRRTPRPCHATTSWLVKPR